jgi:2,4-dienoyl-CoA reductase-like NADH-dependent reductase (Old Yellow Enzyme family)
MGAQLFEPVRVRETVLANRLVHVATLTQLGRDGLPTAAQAAYLRRRAAGGAGCIVTEGVSVHPSSRPHPGVVQAYRPEAFAGLRAWPQAVGGVPVLLQLWHVGRQQLWGPQEAPWGVSPEPDALSGSVPHVMTDAEIEAVLEAFVAAARQAEAAGFAGVELHGAHGYLLTQFLSPWSNTRTDRWGGDAERRRAFVLELARRVRRATGPRFIVGIKLSGHEFVPGGVTERDAADLVAALAAEGLVDVVGVSQGNFSLSLERHVPDLHFPEAPFAYLARTVREAAAGVPVIAMGRIMSRATAERLVAEGWADLVGLSRALLADPDLPRKWRGIDSEPVRPCLACNVCWGRIHQGRPVACVHNPELGEEERWTPPAPISRRAAVVVAGAGPAGLEAAWVLARRGFGVTVYEAAREPGGQAARLRRLAGLERFGELVDYQLAQCARYGVAFRLGTPLTPEDPVEADAVVVATGSAPVRPTIPGWRGPVRVPDEVPDLASAPPAGATAAVVDEDGGYYAYGPAEHLLARGWAVVLVTSRTALGGRLDYLSRIGLERRLRTHDVPVWTGWRVVGGGDRVLLLEDVFTGRRRALEDVGLVVWAGARRAVDDLWRTGRETRFHRWAPIGDAFAPRDLLAAVHEGHRLAREIR